MTPFPTYGLVFALAVVLYVAFYLVPLVARGRALHLMALESLLQALRRDLDHESSALTTVLNPAKRSASDMADERTRLGGFKMTVATGTWANINKDASPPPPTTEPVPQKQAAERLMRLPALRTDYGDGVVQEAVDQIRAQYPDGAYQRFEVERLPTVAAFAERVGAARTMAGLFVLVGLFFTMVRLNGVVGAIADAAGGATMAPAQFLATMGALMNGIGGAFDSSIVGLGLMVVALVAVGGIDLVAARRIHTLERAVVHTVVPGLADLHDRLMPNLTLADLLAETGAHLRTLGTTVRGLTAGLDGSLAGLGDRIADMMGDFSSFQHQYAKLDDLLKHIGEASVHLRDTTGALKGAARRIGDPLDEFNKTLLRHIEAVAGSVETTRDGFETLGEQVAAVAVQTDSAVGRIEASAGNTFADSLEQQQTALRALAAQSAAIEAHFTRLADALGKASQVRIDQSLGRIDQAVGRLAEVEDAPQTLFAYLRDAFARRRPAPLRAPRPAPRPAPSLETPPPTSLFDSLPRPGGDPPDAL